MLIEKIFAIIDNEDSIGLGLPSLCFRWKSTLMEADEKSRTSVKGFDYLEELL